MAKFSLVISAVAVATWLTLTLVNPCKYPAKVADFIWNPGMTDPAGYFLSMSAQPKSGESLPGVPSNDTCTSRFIASWMTADTVYIDCDNNQVRFKCRNIGEKSWILDCVYVASAALLPDPTTTTSTSTTTSTTSSTTTTTTEASTNDTKISVPALSPPSLNYPIWCFWCGGYTNYARARASSAADLSHTVLVSLTDQKTYAFLNRCFYKMNQYDWVVISTTNELPAITKLEISAHVDSLGYNL